MPEQKQKAFIKIYREQYPVDPRKDFDHAGTMVCWHKRYELGDEQPKETNSDWLQSFTEELPGGDSVAYWYNRAQDEDNPAYSEKMMDNAVERTLADHVIMLPLYLYDHSGITMSTSRGYPFNCPWDAGQVGWIYITKEDALKTFNRKRVGKRLRLRIWDLLEAEVDEYDHYLTGAVYCFNLQDEDGEEIDGCGGFYEDVQSVVKYVRAEYAQTYDVSPDYEFLVG